MSTPEEHYRLADQGAEQLAARLENMRQRVATTGLGYAEGELACRLLELEAKVVTVHAILSTVAS